MNSDRPRRCSSRLTLLLIAEGETDSDRAAWTLADASKAHERAQAGHLQGKIVLVVE